MRLPSMLARPAFLSAMLAAISAISTVSAQQPRPARPAAKTRPPPVGRSK
jgi:hypothetical protein